MSESNAQKKYEPVQDVPSPEDEARQQVLDEVAEDAHRAPEQWLRDAEVPKGGE